jgi:hypothetical protein
VADARRRLLGRVRVHHGRLAQQLLHQQRVAPPRRQHRDLDQQARADALARRRLQLQLDGLAIAVQAGDLHHGAGAHSDALLHAALLAARV